MKIHLKYLILPLTIFGFITFSIINAQSLDERLAMAIEKNQTKEAISLLGQGADINRRIGAINSTPLIKASINGNLELVKELLKRGADINSVDLAKKSALSWAIDKASANKDDVEAKQRYLDIANLLIDSGIDINRDFAFAVNKNQKEIVLKLLEKGANPNANDEYGDTPLSKAVRPGHEEMFKLLLEHGANVNAKSGGVGLISQAAQYQNITAIKMLAQAGANVLEDFTKALQGKRTKTAQAIITAVPSKEMLKLAIEQYQPDVVKDGIKAGIPVTQQDLDLAKQMNQKATIAITQQKSREIGRILRDYLETVRTLYGKEGSEGHSIPLPPEMIDKIVRSSVE